MSSFASNFGGSLAGIVLDSTLFGIFTLQTIAYYKNYPSDPWWLKITVALLFVAGAFNLITFTYALYKYLVQGILGPAWQFVSFTDVAVFAPALVQTFLIKRMFDLGGNNILAIVLEICVFIQTGFGIALMVVWNKYLYSNALIVSEYSWIAVVWLALEAGVDLVIAGAMSYLLVRRRTGFSRTDTIITKLVLYSISTGAFTSVIAILIFASFAAEGFSFTNAFLSKPFGGFYAVTMLANLHSRMRLRKQARSTNSKTDNVEVHMTNLQTHGRSQLRSDIRIMVASERTVMPPDGDDNNSSYDSTKHVPLN